MVDKPAPSSPWSSPLPGGATALDSLPRERWWPIRRSRLAAAVLGLVLLAACAGGAEGAPGTGDLPPAPGTERPVGAAPGELRSGMELPSVELDAVLVGPGLAHGSPLPSAQAALDALRADEAVVDVLARRVHDSATAQPLAELAAVRARPQAFADAVELDAWVRGLIAGFAGAEAAAPLELSGVVAHQAVAPGGAAAVGFRHGDVVVVLHGAFDGAVEAARRVLEGLVAGEPGRPDPATPLADVGPSEVFVAVPTLSFAHFAAPEPAPAPPALPGTVGIEGRIGVVAGERRTTVWALGADPAVYPTAEALWPAMVRLAADRSAGPAALVEVGSRLVAVAEGAAGAPAVRVFHHGRTVVMVEGPEAAQVEATTADWIAALGG